MTKWVIPPDILEKYGEKRARRAGEMAFRGGGVDSPIRIDTPEPFKQVLLDIARLAALRDNQTTNSLFVHADGTAGHQEARREDHDMQSVIS